MSQAALSNCKNKKLHNNHTKEKIVEFVCSYWIRLLGINQKYNVEKGLFQLFSSFYSYLEPVIWNTYNPKYWKVEENGQLLRGIEDTNSYWCTVVGEEGWDKGVHRWSVEYVRGNSHGEGGYIGISTDPTYAAG